MKKLSGKTLILVLAIVLVTAGSAFAWGGRSGRPMGAQGMPNQPGGQMWQQQMPGQWQGGPQQMQRQGRGGHRMGGRGCSFMDGQRFGGRTGMWGAIEIPQEIRDKQTEMAKLSIEMRNEMGKNPINRSAIEELYKKRVELRNELSGWRMQQRLDLMEKLQKK
ncbi:hypothetical protein MASR2M79_03700 [Aminivibrio sp.]